MNYDKYNKLMNKLDIVEHKFLTHSTNSDRGTAPTELITPGMDVESLSNNKLAMIHSMLHLFYSTRTGKGLTPKTIEQLHTKVSGKLKKHKKFDGLDKK